MDPEGDGDHAPHGSFGQLETISNQVTAQVDEKMVGFTVACVLELADILALFMDGLYDRSLPDEEFISQLSEAISHILADTGQAVQSLRREVLGQGLRKISFVAHDFAEQSGCQFWHPMPIIEIAQILQTGEIPVTERTVRESGGSTIE